MISAGHHWPCTEPEYSHANGDAPPVDNAVDVVGLIALPCYLVFVRMYVDPVASSTVLTVLRQGAVLLDIIWVGLLVVVRYSDTIGVEYYSAQGIQGSHEPVCS